MLIMEMGPGKSPTHARVEEALNKMSFDEMDLPEIPTSVEWATSSDSDEESSYDLVVEMDDVLEAINKSRK